MLHKHYALDLYQTKTKATGSLRATKLYQALCNRVKGDQVIQENQHAFSKQWTIGWLSLYHQACIGPRGHCACCLYK